MSGKCVACKKNYWTKANAIRNEARAAARERMADEARRKQHALESGTPDEGHQFSAIRVDPGNVVLRGLTPLQRVLFFVPDGAPSDVCWEWPRAVNSAGYGVIRLQDTDTLDPTIQYTHRLSFEHFHRALAPGEHVHHKCANRRCFNPDHLQAASANENTAEMNARRTYEARIAFLEAEVERLTALLEAA